VGQGTAEAIGRRPKAAGGASDVLAEAVDDVTRCYHPQGL